MRAYVINGLNATGTATKTLGTAIASTTARPSVYEIILGSSATPADVAGLFALSRFTAVGTAGSSFTPNPVDPSDVASVTTAGITHSAEPTYTANQDMVQVPLNLRATFRWIANPGFEIKAPATASNGLGLRLVSATTTAVQNGQIFFFE